MRLANLSFLFLLGILFVGDMLAGGVIADETKPEAAPADVKVVSFTASPATIEMTRPLAYQQILLLGETDLGEVVDLTRVAKLNGEPKCVKVSPNRLISSAADGEETLTFAYGDFTATVAVKVSGQDVKPEPSFSLDVQPILSKTGCNQGTCHGSKDGQNGFKLSLRGYDDVYDYRALTDDIGARRFNRAAPDQSLMLLKATGSIPHVGGKRFDVDDPYYQIIRAWIAQGVKFTGDAPTVTSIVVSPKDPILPRAGMKQQFRVLATYSDGTEKDVTREAFIESGDIELLSASPNGTITTLRRGEAPVLVRYEGAYAATTVTCMGDRSGFVWTPAKPMNYIDEHVYSKLQRMKIQPADLCTDAEFLRRVYLDLTGLPPSSTEVRNFLEDPRDSTEKRNEVIDKLIGSPAYIEHWTNKWADLLQVNRKFLGVEGAKELRAWIRESVASNKPYNQFASEVLTASGSNKENPAASYYKILREPTDIMENTTHLFLATRFNCNKCHDHPFERWTQDQYYQLSAYFARVGLKEDPNFKDKKIGGTAVEGAKPLFEIVFDKDNGEVTHDRTGQVTAPTFPFEHADMPPTDLSRREQLSRWITSAENPYFASSYVNRQWGYLLGRGIIEPIDDIRAGNPPTNPELLAALTEDFVSSGFDMQHVHRVICRSRTYQHSIKTTEWNVDDRINYSHAQPRRLAAEVLYDTIHAATGAPLNIPGVPAGLRAAQIPDAGVQVPFLDDFGRPTRESSCECERSDGMVIGPIMKLVNGPTVDSAISDPRNELTKLESSLQDDNKLVEEVFLRFLGRYPTEAEMELGKGALHPGADEELIASEAELTAYRATLPEKVTAWEKTLEKNVSWNVAPASEGSSKEGADFAVEEDGSVFVSGKLAKDVYTVKFPITDAIVSAGPLQGIKLEALADKRLPASGPGRAENGNFVLSELKLYVAPADDLTAKTEIKLKNALADFSQDSWPVANSIDGNPATGWAVSPQFGKDHYATYEFTAPVTATKDQVLILETVHEFQDGKHLPGKMRLSVTPSSGPLSRPPIAADLAKILEKSQSERNDAEKNRLLAEYKKTDEKLRELEARSGRLSRLTQNERLVGVQDLAWALINSPAFLFNR